MNKKICSDWKQKLGEKWPMLTTHAESRHYWHLFYRCNSSCSIQNTFFVTQSWTEVPPIHDLSFDECVRKLARQTKSDIQKHNKGNISNATRCTYGLRHNEKLKTAFVLTHDHISAMQTAEACQTLCVNYTIEKRSWFQWENAEEKINYELNFKVISFISKMADKGWRIKSLVRGRFYRTLTSSEIGQDYSISLPSFS